MEETVTVCTGFAVPAVLETPDGTLELEIEELGWKEPDATGVSVARLVLSPGVATMVGERLAGRVMTTVLAVHVLVTSVLV